jgi:hypothetical protein
MEYWHNAAAPEIARSTEGVLVVVAVGILYRQDELLDPRGNPLAVYGLALVPHNTLALLCHCHLPIVDGSLWWRFLSGHSCR